MVREYLDPPCGITPLFALCNVLRVQARAVANGLGVTPSQLSHYRKGATPVPAARMSVIIKLLELAIKEFEKEILTRRENGMSNIEKELLNDLESRLDTAKKIIKNYKN